MASVTRLFRAAIPTAARPTIEDQGRRVANFFHSPVTEDIQETTEGTLVTHYKVESNMAADRTGAKAFGDRIKQRMEKALERRNQAEERVLTAFDRFDGSMETVESVAKEVEDGADALVASVAQLTNGGPE